MISDLNSLKVAALEIECSLVAAVELDILGILIDSLLVKDYLGCLVSNKDPAVLCESCFALISRCNACHLTVRHNAYRAGNLKSEISDSCESVRRCDLRDLVLTVPQSLKCDLIACEFIFAVCKISILDLIVVYSNT